MFFNSIRLCADITFHYCDRQLYAYNPAEFPAFRSPVLQDIFQQIRFISPGLSTQRQHTLRIISGPAGHEFSHTAGEGQSPPFVINIGRIVFRRFIFRVNRGQRELYTPVIRHCLRPKDSIGSDLQPVQVFRRVVIDIFTPGIVTFIPFHRTVIQLFPQSIRIPAQESIEP